jgi:hypothetical protein
MNEMIEKILTDKAKRNKKAARKAALSVEVGLSWG